jgi:hypothetical protein
MQVQVIPFVFVLDDELSLMADCALDSEMALAGALLT